MNSINREITRSNFVLRICSFALAALLLAINVSVYGQEHISLTNKPDTSAFFKKECNSLHFDDFFTHFSEDISVQRIATKSAISATYVDVNAEPEPVEIKKRQKREELEFPVIPNKRDRDAQQLKLSFKRTAPNTAVVHLTKPDTGFSVFYFFEKQACWFLTEIKDLST